MMQYLLANPLRWIRCVQLPSCQARQLHDRCDIWLPQVSTRRFKTLNIDQRFLAISIFVLVYLTILFAPSRVVIADAGTAGLPEHAPSKSFGSGWECDGGYREVEGACAAVIIPTNAYPTNRSYGQGWECDRGYREVDGACVAVEVLANAYFISVGNRWRCNRRYRAINASCVPVNVPENGYLTSSGNGWECERSYKAVDDACIAVKVPDNAYFAITSYGSGWKCERGY